MNKIDQDRIERRIRSMEETPYCPTNKRIEEIKNRAFEEYEQFLQANKKRNMRKNKKRSILCRVVAVAAFLVCFFVSSFAYSVFAPVTVASANNFVRRAAIWINNQFHLGITFSSPIDDAEDVEIGDGQLITSISDLTKVVHTPIAYIPEMETIRIDNIEVSGLGNEKIVVIRYLTSDMERFSIRIQPYYDSNAIGVEAKYTSIIESPIGTLYVWTDGILNYALCLMNGSTANITSSMSMDTFVGYCQKLHVLN